MNKARKSISPTGELINVVFLDLYIVKLASKSLCLNAKTRTALCLDKRSIITDDSD